MKTVYILRGVSGCGKSTLAKTMEKALKHCTTVSADQYFYDELGDYNFEKSQLGEAHEYCKKAFLKSMQSENVENVIVDNTNTSMKEIGYYVDTASEFNAKVVSLVVEKRHDENDVHNVPLHCKERQERKLKNSLKLC